MPPKKKSKKKGNKKKGKKNPTVEALLVDTAIATGRGLGLKSPSQGAVDFWAKLYKKSYANQLQRPTDWETDRPKVLMQAIKLGRKAKTLAGSNKTITKAIAKKASKFIAKDKNCVPKPGAGKYCPPPGA